MKQQKKDLAPSPSIPAQDTRHVALAWWEFQVTTEQKKDLIDIYYPSKNKITGAEIETIWQQQSGSPIPVKEGQEVLAITKGEWMPLNNEYTLLGTSGKGHTHVCIMIENDQMEANAKAICTAVNGTYGKNLNPAAMEELYKALDELRTAAGRYFVMPTNESIKEEFTIAYLKSETALTNTKI